MSYIALIILIPILGIYLFLMVIIIINNLKKNRLKKIDNRIGYMNQMIHQKYSSNWCTFKVRATGLEFEDGKIEVKVIGIISYGDNSIEYKRYALQYCRKHFQLVNKDEIKWETLQPLRIVTANDLKQLLNNEEVVIEDIRIKLDNKYTHDEIVKIMIN